MYYFRYKTSKLDSDFELYKQNRNNYNSLIRKSKRMAEIKLARESKQNPRKFFSYFSYGKTKNFSTNLLQENNVIIDDQKDIANTLNEYFASVFVEDHPVSVQTHSTLGTKLTNIKLNVEDVKNIVKTFNVHKTAGPDNIYMRTISENIDNLSVALEIIINESLKSSEVPLDWKLANVTPIFKSGDKTKAKNYRPISLTSVVCKILEKKIKYEINNHLEISQIKLDSQHGFRNKRSCLTNLLEFTEYISKNMDAGSGVDTVYLDFAKAFDKVSHSRLLLKLKMLGISGSVNEWIKSWLTNRTQRVVLNGYKSNWVNVKSGVPQGSVLGPLLFSLYINDFGNGLSCEVLQFADDTKLYKSINSYNDCIVLQKDIDKVINWAEIWKMEFNINKCKTVHFGKNNSINFNYEMNGEWLENIDHHRDLGLVVSNDLKFNHQALVARNKANRILGFISKNVSYKNKDVILKLFNAYIRPQLEYCQQARVQLNRADIDMLEGIQRKATRLIPQLRTLPYSERLKELNMFSLEQRFIRGDLIEVYKIINNLDNIKSHNLFTFNDNSRTRGHEFKLNKPRFNSQIRKHSFSQRVIDRWNLLPQDIVNSQSLNIFKSRLDKFMSNLDDNSEISVNIYNKI